MNFPVLSQIESLLKTKLIVKQRITGGRNNKLYKVQSLNGKFFLLKIYSPDKPERKTREILAVSFLWKRGFRNIPRIYAERDNWALYSFEEGVNKISSQLNKNEIVQMAQFLANVHNIEKVQQKNFPPANLACFSIKNYLDNINFRVNKFAEYASTLKAPEVVKNLHNNVAITSRIKDFLNKTLKQYSIESIEKALPTSQRRLSPVDFGAHNIISHPDGSLCFTDFEYFGLDDPLRTVADFLWHDKSRGIKNNLKEVFKNTYFSFRQLDNKEILRFATVNKLVAIEWLAIYLYSITPDKFHIRKFSNGNFRLEPYLRIQQKKLTEHLVRVEKLIKL